MATTRVFPLYIAVAFAVIFVFLFLKTIDPYFRPKAVEEDPESLQYSELYNDANKAIVKPLIKPQMNLPGLHENPSNLRQPSLANTGNKAAKQEVKPAAPARPYLLDELKLNCTAVYDDPSSPNFKKLMDFKYNASIFEQELNNATDICSLIHEAYYFRQEPTSEEEKNYPIAYGILAHKSVTQLLFMLSVIYQPQNEYAVAVDGKTSKEFQQTALRLPTCFHNVRVYISEPVNWCGVGVMTGVLSTVRLLAALATPWKYYQYLSGVDAPIKTNLEMVRIFKTMNGSFNTELKRFQKSRMAGNRSYESPLRLYKSSLSATFSREAAEVIARHRIIHKQVRFLQGSYCPDESLWGTFAGSPDSESCWNWRRSSELPMPGGFDAEAWLARRSELKVNTVLRSNESYYISRFQHWGSMTSASCVFGVGDVPRILAAPHLVAHKFYMRTQPAAYFCILKIINERTEKPNPNFSTELYEKLPGVRLLRGEKMSDITSGI